MPATVRTALATGLLGLFLAGCGGGGGGSGSIQPPVTFTLSTTSIEISTRAGASPPEFSFRLSVANVPPPGVWFYTIDLGSVPFTSWSVREISATEREFTFQLLDPRDIGPGDHRSALRVGICLDPGCAQPVGGGLRTVNLRYRVDDQARLVTLSGNVEAEESTFFGRPGPGVFVPLVVENQPDSLYILATVSGSGISSAGGSTANAQPLNLSLQFERPGDLGPGVYQARVTARVCFDTLCSQEVDGSPAVISTRYAVTATPPADPEGAPVPVLSRNVLSHDVVDAEFSDALNAIVMVAATPRPALHVHDPHSGAATEVLLGRVPTALALAPDGLSAVVGHDGAVSQVILPAPGQHASPAPTEFPVSVPVHDLVLDGRGRVHIVPFGVVAPAGLHTLDLATGSENATANAVHRRSRLQLHPGGDHVVVANYGQAFIRVFDVASGQAVLVGDETSQGSPTSHCDNVWLKEDGAAVYSRCGRVFAVPADPSTAGLTPAGNLLLSAPTVPGTPITWLSQSDARGEVLALEADEIMCLMVAEPTEICLPRLRRYDSASLAQLSVHSTGFVELQGDWYAQRALFVFHDAAGSGRYMVSRTHGSASPHAFMVSVLDP